MSAVIEGGDACVWLSGLAWDDYIRLRDIPESRNVRMTFDEGSLELMSPSKLHERIAELLARLVAAWTEERLVAVQSCGTMTFRREDKLKGLEPDKCYYIQHEAAVRDREELDLAVDPPPDLVIEVDVASPSRDRMPIYANLGVPEVWLWRKDSLRFLVLSTSGEYADSDESPSLPGFPRKQAEQLLAERRDVDETTLVRKFRQSIKGS